MSFEEKNYLGVEIGGTKLQVAIGTGEGKIIEYVRNSVDVEQGALGIRQSIKQAIKKLSSTHSFSAIGIGFGGPVNRQLGTITKSHHVDGWNGFNLVEWLQKHTNCPAFIENDANAAALAEACFGAGRSYESVFYTTMGSGMGGGMVQNKILYHGTPPGETEIGQVRFSLAAENAETHCSGWGIDRKARAYVRQNPNSILASLVGDEKIGEARFLWSAVEQGDQGARNLFERLVQHIAFVQSHIVHLFHPDVLICGGGLTLIGEPLRTGIEKHLGAYIAEALHPPPPLKLAELGESVVCVGALLIAKQGLEKTDVS